jgi:hypothetical protein
MARKARRSPDGRFSPASPVNSPRKPASDRVAVTDLAAARARLAAQRAAWDQQQAEVQNGRPTPTRAEVQSAVAGDLVMRKSWDLSPVAADALDALDDSDPPTPPWVPLIVGTPEVGQLLCALPGIVSPRCRFQWLRDGMPISNAVGLRYTVTAADAGCMIRFAATRMHEVARSREMGPVRPAKRA